MRTHRESNQIRIATVRAENLARAARVRAQSVNRNWPTKQEIAAIAACGRAIAIAIQNADASDNPNVVTVTNEIWEEALAWANKIADWIGPPTGKRDGI